MKNDRVTAGAIAGIVGSVAQNLYGLLAKGLHLTDRDFLDFAQVIMFYKPSRNLPGYLVGTLAHLTFGLIFGAILAAFTRETSSAYHLLKSVFLGAIIWFWCFSVGTFFDFPLFKVSPPGPSLVLLVGALLWGFVAGNTLKLLETRTSMV